MEPTLSENKEKSPEGLEVNHELAHTALTHYVNPPDSSGELREKQMAENLLKMQRKISPKRKLEQRILGMCLSQ